MQVAFETLNKTCLETPVLAFADFDKPFLLETNASKLGLGVVLLQKPLDGCCICEPISDHPCVQLSFYQAGVSSFEVGDHQAVLGIPVLETVVKTDNNPLIYILTTTNLDATWHYWVELLAGFTFSIEYQKGKDNAVADALIHVTSKLNAEAVRSILDTVTIETAGRADTHGLMVAEANE